eukprot:Gregarina_sp_Pseudo_9__766@NODE_1491_length_1552_cov_23_050231_g1381_i0_p1_GENE_NODE_1491_length_1552_cov_23_050231_g1381_i0NODE_1491_length_1552_cov_23_050231_g1381_i0_p1_ORF_typecomplete_len478_score70_57DSPc/PF00782_20/0_00071Init_tRNA_PT/PF04179_12/0_11_NODE_1491_length_1552_cov_23_050231_g1381_i0651498
MKANSQVDVLFRKQLLWGSLTIFSTLFQRLSPRFVERQVDSFTSNDLYAIANELVGLLSSTVDEELVTFCLSLGGDCCGGLANWNSRNNEVSSSKTKSVSIVRQLTAQQACLLACVPADAPLWHVSSVSAWRRTTSFKLCVLRALAALFVPEPLRRLPVSSACKRRELRRFVTRSRASTTDSEDNSSSSSPPPLPRCLSNSALCDNPCVNPSVITANPRVNNPRVNNPRVAPVLRDAHPLVGPCVNAPSPPLGGSPRLLSEESQQLLRECRSTRLLLRSSATPDDSHSELPGSTPRPEISILFQYLVPPVAPPQDHISSVAQMLPGVWLDFTCQRGGDADGMNMKYKITHVVTSSKSCFLSCNPHKYNYLFVNSSSSARSLSKILHSSCLFLYKALLAGGAVMVTCSSDHIGLGIVVALYMSAFSLRFGPSWKLVQRRLPIAVSPNALVRSALGKLELELVKSPVRIPEFPPSVLRS